MGLAQSDVGCISVGALAAFAEGHVDVAAHGALEEHLAACVDCRDVLAHAAGAGQEQPGLASLAALGETAPELLARGTRVGRYVIEELVGRGAMGAVYSASDPDLARKVAVKLLRAEALSDAARRHMRARLLREAQSMARLSHPDVITVFDVGPFGDQLFVAMEYVEGCTLRQWRAKDDRRAEEILAVYERAGNGLAAAHEAGLVHRDFKPDNVLVGNDGRVRVTDFGLARAVDSAITTALGAEESQDRETASADLTMTLTRTGALLGTPAYMAPEQLHGRTADARSDVFSFSAALYEALYGERPFDASTVEALRVAIARGEVRAAPLASRVPRWVRAPLLLGLRATPEERPASMRALLDALRAARTRARTRSRGAIVAACGAIAVCAVFAGRARNGSAGPPARPAMSVAAIAPPAAPAPEAAPHVASTSATAAAPPSATSSALGSRPPRVRPAARRADRAPSRDDAAPKVGNNGAYIIE